MGYEAFSLLGRLSDRERGALADMASALIAAGFGAARLDVVDDAGICVSGRSVRVALSAVEMR